VTARQVPKRRQVRRAARDSRGSHQAI
jgi:hypothetical protein